jgi:hypothetical protein
MTANSYPHNPCTRLPPCCSPSFPPLHMGLVSLCICNRSHFIKQASLRSAYGCCAHPIRSNSTVSISTWRHAALSQRFRPSPIAASHTHLTVRTASWATKFNLRRSGSSSDSDTHEEAAKAAVQEEAIKGRQQTDLMLRCESASISQQAVRFISTQAPFLMQRVRETSFDHILTIIIHLGCRANHVWFS